MELGRITLGSITGKRIIGGLGAALLLAPGTATPAFAQGMGGMQKQQTMPMTPGTKEMSGMKQMQGMNKPNMKMGGMGGMAPVDAPVIPAVAEYAEGKRIAFLHTETSDTKMAKILTDMMGSPVLVVPALAKTPDELLARVYVFTNGLKGKGPLVPLGFQPDVFDAPPGDPGYSPLRKIVLVPWRAGYSCAEVKTFTLEHRNNFLSGLKVRDEGARTC